MGFNSREYIKYSDMKKLLDKNPWGIDLLIWITSSGVYKIMSDLFIDKSNFESQETSDNIIWRLNTWFDWWISISVSKKHSPVWFPFRINFKSQKHIDERWFKIKIKK